MTRPYLRTGVSLLAALVCMVGCHGSTPAAPTAPTSTPAGQTTAAIFLVPNAWTLPAGGGTFEILIATAASLTGNTIAPDVDVQLETTAGTVSNAAPRTDFTGHARITWTGTRSAILTARVGDVVSTAAITVLGATPAPPPPGPSPPPGPDPDPEPRPLFVDIVPTPLESDSATPIAFRATVRGETGSPVPTGLTYAWDFESDGVVDSTLAAPSHLFRAGAFTTTLLVHAADGRGGRGTISIGIESPPAPPPPPPPPAPAIAVTLRAVPEVALIDETVTLTATATPNATGGTIMVYEWDVDGDGTVDQVTLDASTTTSYAKVGTMTPRVRARSAVTSGTATTTIKVVIVR